MEKSDIIEACLESGISSFGITSPILDGDVLSNLKAWLNNNYHGEMKWMEHNIEFRVNIVKKFKWVKSVLVVADNYFSDYEWKGGLPKVSKYAWGDDYHQILYGKLENVLNRLKKSDSKVQGKIYVDTGPILEKVFASQSGIGWQGKNTCLIVNNYGSFCFLGILLLNISLPFDKMGDNKCGNCTKCLDACPTGALVRPNILDARKCISYLTIEKKSVFTSEEEKWLNGWLYGCDICQEVCPWNKKWAKNSKDERYYNRIKILEHSPKEWLAITEEEFGKIFKKSVIKRLKIDRLRRNLLALVDQ